jgi:chromosome segregation ATPase
VSEFVRLLPAALLAETQRASGGGAELCEAHRAASQASALSAAADARAAALRGELAAAARQQEAVRGDAERLQQREGHSRRARLARTKVKAVEARRAAEKAERTLAIIARADRTIAAEEAALAGSDAVSGEALEALAAQLSAAGAHARRRVQDAGAALRRQVNALADAAGRVDAIRCKLVAAPQQEVARRERLRALGQRFEEAEARLRATLLEEGGGGGGVSGGRIEDSLATSSSKRHALEDAKLGVEELMKDLSEVRVAKEGTHAAVFQASADLRDAREALQRAKRENKETGSEKGRRAAFLRVPRLLASVESLRRVDRAYKGSVFGPIGAEIDIKKSARDRAAARAGTAGSCCGGGVGENGVGENGGGKNGDDGSEAASAAATAAASVVARMLESSLSRSVLTQFVVTDNADQSRVLDLVRDAREASAVSRVEPGGVLPSGGAGGGGRGVAARIRVTQDLRDLGVECTLGDIIDAPPEIRRVLEDEAGIDSRTVVSFLGAGRAPSLAAVRRLCPAARALVTPEGVERCLGSRYNPASATTTVEPLRRRSMLFEDSEGAAAKAKAVREATAAVADAERAEAATRAELEALAGREAAAVRALRAASAEYNQLKGKRERAEEDIRNARVALAAERATPGGEAAVERLRAELSAAAERAQEQAARAAREAQELHALAGDAAATEALAAETRARSDALAAVTRIHKDRLRLARSSRRELERHLADEERLAATARAAVGDFAPGGICDPADFDEETAAELAALPNDVPSLERVVDDAEAAAAGISAADSDALRRFRERGAAVARLRAEADAADAAAERAAAKARESRDAWLPRARALIETVGLEFTAAMRRLGCDGDAALVEADDGDRARDEEDGRAAPPPPPPPPAPASSSGTRRPPSPADASVRLRVRFREGEQLQPLDGSRQSGGERSVATVLYLVAMQRVAAAPFRVVDEINQGMDPSNERAVFGVLAEAAGAAGTPQCFLLTPKLLPDLPYSDSVTVLQVVNGPLTAAAVAGPVTAARMLSGRGMLGGGGAERGGGGSAVPARG